MTTLNQSFIRVYAKRQSDSQAATEAVLSGPLSLQVRVDTGNAFSGEEFPVAPLSEIEPIQAEASAGPTPHQGASGPHIVVSGETPSGAENSDCVVGIESAVSGVVGRHVQASQHYVASCVKAPPQGAQIRWPSVGQALTIAAAESLQAAGKTLVQAVAEGMKYIAVSSAVAGVGVTTTAICLARAAAQQGIRVALVDAHFAAPQLAAELGLETSCSWHELAAESEATVSQIPFGRGGVTFYPLLLRSADDLTDWTRSAVVPSLHQIAQAQDLVLLDVGPVLVAWGYGFSQVAEELIDGIVLVRDRRKADEFAANAAIDRLRRVGLEVVVAENFVS